MLNKGNDITKAISILCSSHDINKKAEDLYYFMETYDGVVGKYSDTAGLTIISAAQYLEEVNRIFNDIQEELETTDRAKYPSYPDDDIQNIVVALISRHPDFKSSVVMSDILMSAIEEEQDPASEGKNVSDESKLLK